MMFRVPQVNNLTHKIRLARILREREILKIGNEFFSQDFVTPREEVTLRRHICNMEN